MEKKALIFDIKRDCSEDGPGIRTTVFFKGCNLACIWCQNPEGKEKHSELMYNWASCSANKDGAPCIDVCGEHCITRAGDKVIVDYGACTACGDCTDVCNADALQLSGYWISLDDLLYKILIDKPFFDSSDGGVTLSGGEVTSQMNFVHHFLKALKQQGVHTAIETSGFFNYEKFEKLMLPWLDLVYFDLKLIDEKDSLVYTGQSNKIIFKNFEKLVASRSVPVIPRIPLIPGITTTSKNLRGIASFLKKVDITEATLLPYNPLWTDKTTKLGKQTKYQRVTFMTPGEKKQCINDFQSVTKQTGSI